MGFLNTTNRVFDLIIKMLFVPVMMLAIAWLVISIWGNIDLHNQSAEPKEPSPSKAAWEFTIVTTGQAFLTDNYESLSDGDYILDGFYSLQGDKWVYNKGKVGISEEYFGPIEIERR